MCIRLVSIVRRLYGCLLFTLLLCAATGAQQTGSIEGRVISEPSGQPLPYAHVKLVGPEKTQINSVDADSTGHFSFENLGAGQYQLFASKAGYSEVTKSCEAEQSSNQPPSESPNQPYYVPPSEGKVSIGEGKKKSDVQLELLAPGVISGTVYDQHGEPLPDAFMEALQLVAEDGHCKFSSMVTGYTDDRGQYRLFGLKPGKYYVRLTRVSSRGMHLMGDNSEQLAPTYYPNTPDPEAASLIAVKAGEEASSVDLAVKPTGILHVRGRVVNGLTGEVVRDVATMAELFDPRDPGGRADSVYVLPGGGTFAGSGWTPGTYIFFSRSIVPINHHEWNGSQKIDLNGSNSDGVVVRIFPDVEIHGSVEIPSGSKLSVSSLNVSLEPRDLSDFRHFPARAGVEADGSFTLEHVAAGTYSVEVYPVGKGFYVKSARQGRADALESGVRISGEGAGEPIAIVLSSMAGEITGTVHTSDGKAACGGSVILIPDEPGRFAQSSYPEGSIHADGRFSVLEIPTGVYKAFAWEDAEGVAYRDSNEMKAYESFGTTLQVSEGDKKSLDLLWIREGTGAH